MKAVLIGTDYIKTESGEYKVLEINTNTRIDTMKMELLDWSALTDFIKTSNFTEVVVIYPVYSRNFEEKLKVICEKDLGITFNSYETSPNSITVPYIEDTPSKFIIRISYDTTAIIDDEYARDNYNFLRALEQSEHKPKTYIPARQDDFIDLTEFNYSVDVPNFIVKQRFPNYDKQAWPKLYKVTNLEELKTLKSSIERGSTFLQEFSLAELSGDKRNIIRGIDIIYGGNLDVISMGGYKIEHTISEAIWENTYNETGLLANKDRPKYITYYNGTDNKWTYMFDQDQLVLMSDYSKKPFLDVHEDDLVKSMYIDGLPDDETQFVSDTWTGSYAAFVENMELTDSIVLSKADSAPLSELFIRITLEDDITWDDLPASNLLIREGDIIRFKLATNLQVGDVLELLEVDTQTILSKAITNLEIVYKEDQLVGSMDVEPKDIYLPFVSEKVTLIQHNACNTTFCGPLGVPQCYIYPKCSNCTNAQCGK